MLVLAIDTSTAVMTVGLARVFAEQPAQLLCEQTFAGAFSHAEQLMPLARQVLAEADLTFTDLNAIVVGLGPGPFTGLRVGIASAAALGDALLIPVFGAPSHDAVAAAWSLDSANTEQRPFAVVTDARRREVYLSGYVFIGDVHRPSRVFGPEPIPPAEALSTLARAGLLPALLMGSGVHLIGPSAEQQLDPTVLPAPSTPISLGLVQVAEPASDRQPPALVPLYLRRPDATEPGARKSVLGR